MTFGYRVVTDKISRKSLKLSQQLKLSLPMVNDVHSSKVSISDSHNKPDGNDASTNKRNSTVQFLYMPHASNFIHRSVSKKKTQTPRRRAHSEQIIHIHINQTKNNTMHRFIKWHNAVAAAAVDLEQIHQHGDHTGNLQFHCHLDLSCPGTNNKYMHTQTDNRFMASFSRTTWISQH